MRIAFTYWKSPIQPEPVNDQSEPPIDPTTGLPITTTDDKQDDITDGGSGQVPPPQGDVDDVPDVTPMPNTDPNSP